MGPALAIFAAAVVAQWLLPLSGIWRHERVISRGTLVRIECGAPDADRLVAERVRSGIKTVAEVRLLDGRAVLTDLLCDGVSIRDVVNRGATAQP